MTERKTGRRSDGQPRVRRVIQRAGVDLRVMLASQVDSDRKTQRRLEAFDQAGSFLQKHAGEIDFYRSGRVEDRDAFFGNAGEELRSVTLALLDADVELGGVVRRAQKGLLAPGSSDPDRMSVIARTFGEILAADRDAVLAERAEAAPVPTPTPK